MSKYLFILFLFCMTSMLWSQSDSQEKLEERKAQIQKEIQLYQNLLKTEKNKEKSVLTRIVEQSTKIQLTEKLIKNTQLQANLLDKNIDKNKKQINQLIAELKDLKEDYAKMIVKSYKSRSEQSRIMFLLSSNSFLQAYKRARYMKQYANYRKKQGDEIKAKSNKLELYNKKLVIQKSAKEKLIVENKEGKISLEKNKKNQQVLMKVIKKDQKKYLVDIMKKQQESTAIDKQIKKLVQAAIVATNVAAKKRQGETSSSIFNLTPEAKVLSTNFKANKGKLPWPVEKGLLTLGYGDQTHPLQKNLVIHNSGVEITTESGATARTIFEGEVLTVQVLTANNKAIYIQHGDFITVYLNIESVSVSKGDRVSIKQKLGKIYTNQATGRTVLKFLVLQNTNMLNPEHWLINM